MNISFYIAGVQKSGTTNLAYLLSKYFNIITHPQLECTFFYDNNEYKKGNTYLKNNYFFNIPKYLYSSKQEYHILIKHSNTFTDVMVMKKALQHSPDIKFLLIFRNPIQRFVSSFLMERTRSLYPHPIEKAIDIALNDKNSIEHRIFYSFGEYDKYLENIVRAIDEKKLYLFLFENLYNNTYQHLKIFAQQFGLQMHWDNTQVNDTPIQNPYKEYKKVWYQKMIIRLKHAPIKQQIKKIIPTKYWVNITQKLESINLVEPQEKYVINSELEMLLKEKYYPSIKRFEALTGLKTNWLE
ncbi:MAG: sulfotransferase domain-containing protein [Bacteroidales bacterium]